MTRVQAVYWCKFYGTLVDMYDQKDGVKFLNERVQCSWTRSCFRDLYAPVDDDDDDDDEIEVPEVSPGASRASKKKE